MSQSSVFAASSTGLAGGICFSSLMLIAALGDVRSRRIPNMLVLTVALSGLLFSAFVPPSWGGALRGIEGLGTALACWLPFYAMGWLGAGDVKLAAAAGAWLGPRRSVEASLIAALLGAVLAFTWMLRVRGIKNSAETLGLAVAVPRVLADSRKSADGMQALPYAVVIAIGALSAAWLPGLLLS
jgi:prepilin peptidase CpaA